jgi:hypothetical protein
MTKEQQRQVLNKSDVSNSLPDGFISVDEKLPLHRQSVNIFTSEGRILEAVYKIRMFKVDWDVDYNDQKAIDGEFVLGWSDSVKTAL